jgi:virginiamycin B lyase
MVDLTKKLPLELSVAQKDITIPRGQSTTVDLHLASSDSTSVVLLAKTTAEFGDIAVQIPTKNISLSGSQVIPVSITANQSALPGVYKVLISARTNDVTVSQFVTVTVTQ